MTSTKSPVLFWKDHCFSLWYPAPFEVDDKPDPDSDDDDGEFMREHSEYANAEQYMMAEKAMVMKDYDTYMKIMETTDPKTINALGRQIKDFNAEFAELWDKHKLRIMIEANFHKFSDERNAHMRKILMDTGNALIVEASPYDSIWGSEGAGLGGQNLLGKALMDVRSQLAAIDRRE